MMSSGMNAAAGRYRSSPMIGSNRAQPERKLPMMRPSGTDTRMARPNPMPTRCMVAAASTNSCPDRAISQPAARVAAGVGR